MKIMLLVIVLLGNIVPFIWFIWACPLSLNMCTITRCQNGGTCVPDNDTPNSGGFKCLCKGIFTGTFCEHEGPCITNVSSFALDASERCLVFIHKYCGEGDQNQYMYRDENGCGHCQCKGCPLPEKIERKQCVNDEVEYGMCGGNLLSNQIVCGVNYVNGGFHCSGVFCVNKYYPNCEITDVEKEIDSTCHHNMRTVCGGDGTLEVNEDGCPTCQCKDCPITFMDDPKACPDNPCESQDDCPASKCCYSKGCKQYYCANK